MWRRLATADSLGAIREASASSSRRLPSLPTSSPRPLPVKSRTKTKSGKMMMSASSSVADVTSYFPFSPARPKPLRLPDPSPSIPHSMSDEFRQFTDYAGYEMKTCTREGEDVLGLSIPLEESGGVPGPQDVSTRSWNSGAGSNVQSGGGLCAQEIDEQFHLRASPAKRVFDPTLSNRAQSFVSPVPTTAIPRDLFMPSPRRQTYPIDTAAQQSYSPMMMSPTLLQSPQMPSASSPMMLDSCSNSPQFASTSSYNSPVFLPSVSPSHLPVFNTRSVSPFLLPASLSFVDRPPSALGRPGSMLARGMASSATGFAPLGEEEDPLAEFVPEPDIKKSKKRKTAAEELEEGAKTGKKTTKSKAPEKSVLNPPKAPQSKWQMYFSDYLTSTKSTNPDGKINVTAIAKAAAAAYKNITVEEHEALNKRVKQAKDAYKRELTQWQKTLTPEDVKIENAYRAAQRKAGQSRKPNMKDPNAPKKPMSPYFSFLAAIRSDAGMIREVFGDVTETTQQSRLAAKRWRELSDEEKAPFFKEAERQKAEYEAKLAEYESQFVTTVTRRPVSSKASDHSRSSSITESE